MGARLSCRLNARNLDSGLSQWSSCQVMSAGARNSARPSSACARRNLISPLRAGAFRLRVFTGLELTPKMASVFVVRNP